MASRKTIRINFVAISPQLKDLVSELPDHAQFIQKHGSLLNLVTTARGKEIGLTTTGIRAVAILWWE